MNRLAFQHFDATLASFTQRCRPTYPSPDRPWEPQIRHLAGTRIPFSISRSSRPSFHSTSGEASENRCPDPQKSRTQGLATLSTVLARAKTPGNLFQLPTLLGFLPTKLSSSSVIENLSRDLLSALALSYKTHLKPCTGASTASSH